LKKRLWPLEGFQILHKDSIVDEIDEAVSKRNINVAVM
jgi:hypothetical protein